MSGTLVLVLCAAWLGLIVWVLVDIASFAQRHWARTGFTKGNWIALVAVTFFLGVLSPFAVFLYLAWPRPKLIAARDAQENSHDVALREVARLARQRHVDAPSLEDISTRMHATDQRRED